MFLNGKGSLRRRHHLTLVIREFTKRRRRRRRRQQRERQKITDKFRSAKQTTLHVHHLFLNIFLPSLHDYNVKLPNFTFCRGREQKTTTFFFSSGTLIESFKIQLQQKFAIIWRIKRDGTRLSLRQRKFTFKWRLRSYCRRRCVNSLVTFSTHRPYPCSGSSTGTQRITGNAFWISFQPDWQIHSGIFNWPIMACTQILVHRWGPTTRISVLFCRQA